MFSRFPNFFDRDFAVGSFLPALLFLLAVVWLGGVYDVFHTIVLFFAPTDQVTVLLDTTLLVIGAWLGGVMLLALNRDAIRVLEGYGRWNPLRLGMSGQHRRYQRYQQQLHALDIKYHALPHHNTPAAEKLLRERSQVLERQAESFPDQEEWVLPTSFGNIIRAFEVYPYRMYGMDVIPGWSRVLAVVPESYQRLIDHEKSLVDFWVNVCLLSTLYGIGYVFLLGYTWLITGTSVPGYLWVVVMLGAMVIVWLSYTRAKAAAREWGEVFKAAFDLYLPALQTQLMFPAPATPAAERQMWESFSRAILYHDPDELPTRQQPTCDQKEQQKHLSTSIDD